MIKIYITFFFWTNKDICYIIILFIKEILSWFNFLYYLNSIRFYERWGFSFKIKRLWFWSLQICLVLVLVFVIFFVVFGPCKMFCFLKIVPPGTISKNKIFCRDLFKNQNILQGLFFYKMGSGIMWHVSKSSQKLGQGPKPKWGIFVGTKKNKKLQGLKPKRGIFAGTKTIF